MKIVKGSVSKLEVTYKTLHDFSELKKFPLRIRIIKPTNKREAGSPVYWYSLRPQDVYAQMVLDSQQ